jgi:hypothetical protein
MTDCKGRFEKGLWITEKEPPVTKPDRNLIENRVSEAKKSVRSSVDDVMNIAYDLVTTEEGKQYIEKTIKDTHMQIQKSFDEIVSRVKDELDNGVKTAK